MTPAGDGNVFTDLSGTSNSTTGNPYDALLEACKQEPVLQPPSQAPHTARNLIYPRIKSSSAIKRTARPATLNKKASCSPRISQASSSTKSYTSLSTRRNTPATRIRGIVWFFGRDRRNVFGDLWAICRNGYLIMLRVSSSI